MRTPQEIIAEFRNVLYWSQPNIKHDDMLSLLNELEASLHPVEEPTEEHIIEVSIDVVEQPTVESLTIETTIEEPIVEEVVAPKKRPRKV